MDPWWGRNAVRAARVKSAAMTRSGWIGSCFSAQHNAYGRGRRPPGRPSSSLAPRSAASCMGSPPMTRPAPCASGVCPRWGRSAPGWCLPGPSTPAWGSGGCTPGRRAALPAVEEARARSVKVPVTGAGSLFCAGAVIGPDRQLPCRARTAAREGWRRRCRAGRLSAASRLAPGARLAEGQASRLSAPASAAPAP
jgi:hypothetical protein